MIMYIIMLLYYCIIVIMYVIMLLHYNDDAYHYMIRMIHPKTVSSKSKYSMCPLSSESYLY